MKNQKETIRRMVTYLNNEEKDGGFWLPNIQRPFVWTEDQIERLFDSIMREYPISTLLVWRTKSQVRRRKFIDNYRQNIKLTDFYVPQDSKTKLLVLDGQQRLQSLYIGLRGSYEGRELYFNVLSGLITYPEDVRYKFKFLDPKKASFPWVRFKEIVFSDELYNRISDSIIKNSGKFLNEEEIGRINDNVALIVKQFVNVDFLMYQELDGIDNSRAYQDDDVVEIFIRANSGGTQLGKSDLLFSLLTSSWEYSNERMEELIEELNRTGYDFTRDFVLKTCLTLMDKGARYEVNKFRDDKTRDQIINKWDDISVAIRDVKDSIFGRTFLRTDKAISSYLGLIPIIYSRYHYLEKWEAAKTQLNEYLLRTLITGAFTGNPDNVIDKCVQEIKSTGGFNVKGLFGVIKANGRNLDVTKETILCQSYDSKGIHLIFNLWYKDFNYIPAYENNLPQIDHIFPQSLLRSIKVENPETRRRDLMKYKKEDRNQIANCMLLTAEENGSGGKGDASPESWFADKDDAYLEMHLIPKDRNLWKLENFDQFIEERKKLILNKFDYMIQNEK